jgi:acyl dehydratase
MTSWADVRVPTELPEIADTISYRRVIMNAGATWDYFPGHYDPAYAQKAGHPTIFVNTMHVAGFIDRAVGEWAGPFSRVVRRKMKMLGPIYAGDSIVGRGHIVNKRSETPDGTTRYLVDVEVEVSSQRGDLRCAAEVTVELSQ